MRSQREVTLPLRIDPAGVATIPAQLAEQLRRHLADGALRPGEPLASSRTLASHLGVSRGSVVAAYDQLTAEGWLEASPGRATIVNPRLHDVRPPLPVADGRDARGARSAGRVFAERSEPSDQTDLAASAAPGAPGAAAPIDLRPGRPLQAGVVGPEWRAAWRRASDASIDEPVPPLGWPPLRRAIAEQLRRRAVLRDAEQIVITAGGREGLTLLLRATGARSVGVEEPGYPSLRRVLARFGVQVLPLPTDADGLMTGALPADAPDLVIVTPSHQYPLGGSLPVDRRQQLLAWASARGGIVVEDDYDSELRYTSAPLPALTSLDADGRVALLGTFAKTLTPALAMGYVVVPPALAPAVTAVRRDLGQSVGLVPQRALADYLDSGALTRHTQRMRNLYRRRRALVVRALRGLPDVHVYPMDGGLHAVVEHERDEGTVIAALSADGVAVSALSEYWAGGGPRRGFVFGFGGVSDADLATALTRMVATLTR